MLIQEKQAGAKQLFYVEQDGRQLAEMVFTLPTPGIMVVEHTEVDGSLNGKGIGKQLVHRAVEYAREHHLRLIPYCPFTKAVLERTPEWQDVLKG